MILRHTKILYFSIVFTLIFSGCKFNKIKKSKDPDVKYQHAEKFYEAKKYSKASLLYEDIYYLHRGTEKGKTSHYHFAYTHYYMKNYYVAGHYFRKYVEDYPKCENTEDAMYMSAYCYYLDAPKSKLDQTATKVALEEFNQFLSKFPDSEKIQKCNELIDELRFKLEKKSYDNAILYYNIGYYRAATIALKNSLQEYPDSKFREQSRFYILKSQYLFAKNSIKSKQEERYSEVLKEYDIFAKKYPKSDFMKEADEILKKTKKELEKQS